MQDKNGAKRQATEHPMYAAMKDLPNDEISAQTFRETRTSHALLQGNGYAKVVRRSGTGTAMQLQPLLPSQIEPDREKTGQKRASRRTSYTFAVWALMECVAIT
jgi:phage portal protein BeeE